MRASRSRRGHGLLPLALLVAAAVLAAACTSSPTASRERAVADGTTEAVRGDNEVRSITVAAASDLRPAFEELGALFEATTGTAVTFSFGSSGQLREQIINGAPFDLFASANAEYVDEVIAAGRGVADTKAAYALGRIVLWTPTGVARPDEIHDLTDSRFRRIAIANPEHAPYGRAAKQALENAGIYPAVQSRLVYGESVSDTFRIVESRSAEVGIVALSIAIANGGEYTLVPAELHEPLEQALVVTSTGPTGEAAAKFAEFIGSPQGRAVMTRYGFVLPGDPAPALAKSGS